MNTLDDRVSALENDVTEIKVDISTLNAEMHNTGNMLKKVDKDLEWIKGTLFTMGNSLGRAQGVLSIVTDSFVKSGTIGATLGTVGLGVLYVAQKMGWL